MERLLAECFPAIPFSRTDTPPRAVPGQIAFASSFPGSIKAVDIAPGKDMIVQKKAFLASESSVELSIFFQKKIGAGLFGGEGFIMQRLSGNGTAFIEIDGYAVEYNLQAGQSMVIDTGYIAAMDPTCSMEIVSVPGVKNMLFGGEGIFNTVVKGPGKNHSSDHANQRSCPAPFSLSS